MEDVASVVFDFFAERHIALKEEWFSCVLAYLRSSSAEIIRRRNVADLVFQQWMYTDLKETSYPTLDQLALEANGTNHPLVVQIQSVVDIGAPFHSQYNTLVYEFIDDTGFEPLPEMEREAHSDIWEKPRRMLLLEVSDGETILRAIEYRTIKEISLLTKPGCKVLVIPPVRYKKGVLLLEPRNLQIIGGDVESLFATGRPLAVMAKKLNIDMPSISTLTTDKVVQNNKNQALQVEVLPSDSRRYSGSSAIPSHETTAVTDDVGKRVDVHLNEDMARISFLRRVRSKPVAEVSPIHQVCHSSSVELEDSPPDFEAELDRLRQTASYQSKTPAAPSSDSNKISSTALGTSASTTSEEFHSREVEYSGCMDEKEQSPLQTQAVLKIKRNKTNEWRAPLNKKVKVEVVTLDDDENERTEGVLRPVISAETATQSCSQLSSQPMQVDENDLTAKFRALNIVRLAEATRLMRFAVGSCCKTVQAVVVDIVDSLRIVDGMWTMKVTIQDESCDKLLCFIDNASLTSLIGLTPQEAMEVRASSDINRRRDGQRRLATVETQLKRLDLLLELELFSGSRADPVIRSIRTLVQALDLL